MLGDSVAMLARHGLRPVLYAVLAAAGVRIISRLAARPGFAAAEVQTGPFLAAMARLR